jgi:glutamine cyclotransferase
MRIRRQTKGRRQKRRSLLLITFYFLLYVYHLLFSTFCLLLTVYCLLSSAFCLLPSAFAESSDVRRYTVRIIKTLPHNTRSFTQGLVYYDGMLYESTGLYGQSSLQKIEADSGIVQQILPVPDVFAEGLARWKNHLIQLTWMQNMAFIYNLSDFSRIGTFQYETEGWGLTADDRHLIMSDGTDVIYFRDPLSFATERTVHVTFDGKPVDQINELEYIDGFIYANVWCKNYIIQIDPVDGKVVGDIDARPLFRMQRSLDKDSVLNGIAYNNETHTLYVTGKNWPTIFEVSVIQGF